MDQPEPDSVMQALRLARPQAAHPSDLSPESPRAVRMMEEILSQAAPTLFPKARKPGIGRTHPAWRWSAGAAVATLLFLAVYQIGGLPPDVDTVPDTGAAILKIASSSERALQGSGRAQIVFTQEGSSMATSKSVTSLAFSGEDLEMVIDFAGQDGRDGFQAQNRTVDGQFYLLDGPPGEKEWIRDTNSASMKGTDFFNLDPRTLLSALGPQVGFRELPQKNGLRHFRASKPALLKELSLGDPVDPKTITSLDVWAGDDNVVRRLQLVASRTETGRPGARSIVVEKDGRMTKIVDPADTTPEVTRTIRTTYNVEFSDIGQPVEIKAPPNPRDVGLVG